jgi:two-component system, OmpR family, sensor kinase
VSIRLRLALWYTAFLAFMFVVFAPAVYVSVERQLFAEADRWLAPVADRVVRSVTGNAGALDSLKSSSSTQATGDASAAQVLNALAAYQDLDLERFTSPGVFIELLDANGKVMARSPNLQGGSLPVPDGAFASAWWGTPDSFTTSWNGTRYRGYLAPIAGDREPRGFVLAGRSLQDIDGSLGSLRLFLLAGNLAGLLLAVGVGWLIARNGLRPIEEITGIARSIALSQGFGQRVKVGESRDEVGRLAVTLNEMLASLDTAYAAQRRFVADASHELRSPLTSIRSNIDILRRALDAPREDRAEALSDVAAEVDRMSRLTSDLLLLARADAGHKIEMSRLSMDRLLADVHRQMGSQAQAVHLELGPVRKVAVTGNPVWLKQLLLILLDNALKYTPPGGSVRLSLDREEGMAVVRVSDTGIGIASDDLAHVFERFYRADKARARDEGGAGLGLSIAHWIAEEHEGELTVESEQGNGTTFTLRMPAVR